jgi:hypothetical protein
MLEEIASTGETPLQHMLRVMRDPEATPARRDAMAAAAAPYIHPRMAQVDMHAQYDVPIGGVRFWTEEEWLASQAGQESNPRLITDASNDTIAIDGRDEH